MTTLKGEKSPYQSLGIMGPVTGGLGWLGANGLEAINWIGSDLSYWAEVVSILWGLGSGIYGRWRARQQVAPLMALALVVFLFAPGLAFAQDTVAVPENVVLPWGEWVVAFVNSVLPAVLLLLSSVSTWVVTFYVPSWLRQLAGSRAQQRVNEVLFQAANSAAAQIKGAAVGKKLTIPVANQVLRRIGQYAVDQAPDLMKSVTGGDPQSLIKMILARMEAMGMTPANYDIETAKKAVKPGDFTFDSAIKKMMG